ANERSYRLRRAAYVCASQAKSAGNRAPSGAYLLGLRRRRRGRRCRGRLSLRIAPAFQDFLLQLISSFDVEFLIHRATKTCLDVAGRAAEPIVKVEMAEGGIEVIVD